MKIKISTYKEYEDLLYGEDVINIYFFDPSCRQQVRYLMNDRYDLSRMFSLDKDHEDYIRTLLDKRENSRSSIFAIVQTGNIGFPNCKAHLVFIPLLSFENNIYDVKDIIEAKNGVVALSKEVHINESNIPQIKAIVSTCNYSIKLNTSKDFEVVPNDNTFNFTTPIPYYLKSKNYNNFYNVRHLVSKGSNPLFYLIDYESYKSFILNCEGYNVISFPIEYLNENDFINLNKEFINKKVKSKFIDVKEGCSVPNITINNIDCLSIGCFNENLCIPFFNTNNDIRTKIKLTYSFLNAHVKSLIEDGSPKNCHFYLPVSSLVLLNEIKVNDTVIVIKEDKFCSSLRLNDVLKVTNIHFMRSVKIVTLYSKEKDCYYTTSSKNVKLYNENNKI